MTKFLFTYHGGHGMETDQAEMERVMGLWGSWYASLGEAIVDGGAPAGTARTVGSDGSLTDGGGANPVTGYTIITADSLEAACDAAKGCPVLEADGSVEVSELLEVPGM